VLASANTVGHEFECPHCQAILTVPEADTQIEIHQQSKIVVANPSDEVEHASKNTEVANVDLPITEQETLQNQHFMTTWGDYLAKAGLTNDEKRKKTKD